MIPNTRYKIPNTLKGFTIIEAMTFLFIFSIIVLTFYHTILLGTEYIASSKNRLGAVSIADEKMEIIRNMKYEDIGTVSGSISGSIQDYENVTENDNPYKVHTTVEYVDDSFDGVAPADTAPEDYKKVTVAVSWNSDRESVIDTARFVPDGMETANPGDGYLRINVFSDQPGGSGIQGSSVHVVNADTGLDTTVITDSSGSVILMGDKITDSIQKYRITLSKSGYEDVTTMPPYPDTTYDPVDVDASVVTGSMNMANIVQDELASLKVATVDYLGNAIPNINFHIVGGRLLGHTVVVEPDLPEPVYNLDADAATNSSGEKDFGEVSPGQYVFTLDPSVTNYTLIDTDPISPASVFSNDSTTLKAELADNNATSLIVKIVSSIDGETPVSGATVELINSTLGYDETQTSSATGTAFFPDSSDIFQPGTYDLKITADGFSEKDSQITIDQDQLKTDNVTLNSL